MFLQKLELPPDKIVKYWMLLGSQLDALDTATLIKLRAFLGSEN